MLNKNNLAIAALASSEESRYVLNSVYVTQKETVVTDGHRAVIVTVISGEGDAPLVSDIQPAEEFEPFMIPASLALEVAESLAKGDKVRLDGYSRRGRRKSKTVTRARQAAIDKSVGKNGHVSLGIADRQGGERVFKLPKMTGQFPNIDKVVPKKEAAIADASLNLHILIPLLQQILKFNPGFRKSSEVRLRLYGPDKVIRLDAKNSDTGQQLTAVIMPMRGSDEL